MVVMDQYTRRIIGFAVHAGVLDGPIVCRMFNSIIVGSASPQYPGDRSTPNARLSCLKAIIDSALSGCGKVYAGDLRDNYG